MTAAMIIGIGTDLLEIGRMARILEQPSGGRFLERVLTERERSMAASRRGRLAEFAAGRFAAKEAVAKAFGCGIGRQLGFQDIEVLSDDCGKPVCRLSESAWARLGHDPAATVCHLSITHGETAAVAYAVVEHVGPRRS